MKIFRSIKLLDRYKIEESKEPNDEGEYVLFHEIKSLRGYNCQRVFKGNFKQCHIEKKRLEEIKKLKSKSRKKKIGSDIGE